MTFAILGRTALLATTRRQAATTFVAASKQQSKRRMASHAAAAPEWTGIDKVVRGYFPQDDQREFYFVDRNPDLGTNQGSIALWQLMVHNLDYLT